MVFLAYLFVVLINLAIVVSYCTIELICNFIFFRRFGSVKVLAEGAGGQYIAVSLAEVEEGCLDLSQKTPLPLVAVYSVDRDNFRVSYVWFVAFPFTTNCFYWCLLSPFFAATSLDLGLIMKSTKAHLGDIRFSFTSFQFQPLVHILVPDLPIVDNCVCVSCGRMIR